MPIGRNFDEQIVSNEWSLVINHKFNFVIFFTRKLTITTKS